MKRNIVFVTFLFFSLYACSPEQKVVEETYPDGSEKRICWYVGKGENREMIREATFYPNKQK